MADARNHGASTTEHGTTLAYARSDQEGCYMRTMIPALFSTGLILLATAGLAQTTLDDPTPIDQSSDTNSTTGVCTTHKTGDAQAVSDNCREAFQRIGKRGLKKACAGTLGERYQENVTQFLAVCHCPSPCIE